MEDKKVLLGASYSIIEPLGLFHLSSVARQEGYNPKIVLGREPDFIEIREAIDEFEPDFFGFTLYTGNHVVASRFLDEVKKRHPKVKIIVGGPHATAFPRQANRHADFTVLSEGFHSFREILRGEAKKGIVPLKKLEYFPLADREDFYRNNPEHKKNPIKNIITQTGCPFRCTYCYNSNSLEDIASELTQEQLDSMQKALGPTKRLFPKSKRSVEDILLEVEEIQRLAPETKMIFFQDDSFGVDMDWLTEFTKQYNRRLPFHIMTRFGFIDPKKESGKKRIDLLKRAGCSGITLAIESANPVIRREVLNREMSEELMFRVLDYVGQLGMKVRTFSMLGLPYGATKEKTKVNLEEDLRTLELNVRLKRETGLPTVAWASVLVPYPRTKIDSYCRKHGFYGGDYSDIMQVSYRKGSVLNFPKEWVGPKLSAEKKDYWLSETEQEEYKERLDQLMRYFPLLALMPKGDLLAEEFLKNGYDLTPEGFNDATRFHLYDHELFKIK